MSWDITVAGTVHVDDITTPSGAAAGVLGGSAVYFALAAARAAAVHVNGIVGSDHAAEFRELLRGRSLSTEGLVVSGLPTFRWRARHDFEHGVAVDTSSDEGCDPTWRPRLSPRSAQAPVLFLASMRPALQREVLAQSSARLVGADSMTDYTGPERAAVREVVHASDILFLNRNELASLTGGPPTAWREEATAMCGVGRLRAVVVKGGADGAALVTAGAVASLPPAQTAQVVDPTGAGDALAGGFLGACAAAERDDDLFLVAALREGLLCAAAAISDFGTAGLVAMP